MSTLPESEQLLLFHTGINIARLKEMRETLMCANKAPNTRSAYRSAWNMFLSWCREVGRNALPSSVETVSLYVAYMIEVEYRMNSVQVHMSAIADAHETAGLPSPIDPEVQKMLINAARMLKEPRQCKKALTVSQLRKIIGSRRCRDVTSVRNRALLAVGFALGWRRCEISSLDLGDVAFYPEKLVVALGASKADQDGAEGRVVHLPYGKLVSTCPVRALQDWVQVRGSWAGPLFCRISSAGRVMRGRLSGASICTILQERLEAIGEDATLYGAHSLRAGMATAAAENGASLMAIMQRGGWNSVHTVLRYVRPAEGFRADPLKGVL